MSKCKNKAMTIRLILTLYLLIGVSPCHAAWIDLGTYADLTDKADDAAALEAALEAAGDGGIVYIPAGTVVLHRPVIVKDVSVRLYGAGMAVTTIAPDFPVVNPQTAALSFMASGRATRSLV